MPAISIILLILAFLLSVNLFMGWRLKKVTKWQLDATEVILVYSVYEMITSQYKTEENNYTKYLREFNSHYFDIFSWGKYSAFKSEHRSKMKAFRESSVYVYCGIANQILLQKYNQTSK